MDVELNIANIKKRLAELDAETKRLLGMLEVFDGVHFEQKLFVLVGDGQAGDVVGVLVWRRRSAFFQRVRAALQRRLQTLE